jgi:hypothetical protein
MATLREAVDRLGVDNVSIRGCTQGSADRPRRADKPVVDIYDHAAAPAINAARFNAETHELAVAAAYHRRSRSAEPPAGLRPVSDQPLGAHADPQDDVCDRAQCRRPSELRANELGAPVRRAALGH